MAFLNAMNISASGLTAQRLRLDVISENIANAKTTRTESGQPYRRKMVVFEPSSKGSFKDSLINAAGSSNNQQGVMVTQVEEDNSPLKQVYDPKNPDADANGYVSYPNVDLLKETVDSMDATRSYYANVTAFNAIKDMATKGLEVGK
ncbi:MAG: flagellar basal body rod protein FlgC [Clostridia bacterium]|jgi:flagellar basal-body rod protein FlgC|nr:flagellar basal body rod protein FlgC [Clostridia bacterium]MCI1999906.1 flagellar basal body rod protein FlgC [Clostridia bacterium]MCI2014178.1 flagellar basal body rod protein FlgC [Clostridia bacterium]